MSIAPIKIRTDKNEFFAYYPVEQYLIGKGGMGQIYRGWNLANPSDIVAIKHIYPQHSANDKIRARARYEASLAIDHPNIIRMRGYSELVNTDRRKQHHFDCYVVSDYVQGNTINKFVKSIHIENRTEIVSKMMCSVLDALSHLHSLKVLHRDIKPSNIMVENGSLVRLMDLGIATSDGISFGTLEGVGFGTYAYTPPEQITGKRNEMNNTSDLYSLGVTFYELLTGRNPFAGGSDIDILERQVNHTLPNEDIIPRKLFRVLLKATAKKQANRYQTAAEFKDAVEKALIPTSPVPISGWLVWGSVAAMVILLIFFLVF